MLNHSAMSCCSLLISAADSAEDWTGAVSLPAECSVPVPTDFPVAHHVC